MGRLSGVKKALDMAKKARMQRAISMGFDLDFPLTHSGGELKEIKKGGLFDGVFASPGYQSAHGGGVDTTLVARRPIARQADWDLDYNKSIETLKREYPDATSDELADIYEISAADKNVFEMGNNPLERFGYEDLGEASWEGQRLRGRIAQDQGFDAVAMSDEHGTSYLLPHGSKARSVDAAFDPDKKDSGNLLAGLSGAAVGLAALFDTPEAQAKFQDFKQRRQAKAGLRDNAAAMALQYGQSQDNDQILPVGGLYGAAEQIDKYTNTPIGPLFSGVTDWMRGAAEKRDESNTEKLKRAAFAALDTL